MKKAVLLLIAVLIVTIGCQLAPGTVKGKLVDGKGAPKQKISLQLLQVTDQQGDRLWTRASSYKMDTDEKGSFSFDKVESGKYVIMVLNVSFVLGGQPPSWEEMLIRGKDNKVLIFEATESKGIDLGELTWNK